MRNSALWYHIRNSNQSGFPKPILFRTDTAFKQDWARSSDWFDQASKLISTLPKHFPSDAVLKFAIILSELHEQKTTRSKFTHIILKGQRVCVGFSSPYLWKTHDTLFELSLSTTGQMVGDEFSVREGAAFYPDGVCGDHQNLLPLIQSYLNCKTKKDYDRWSKHFEGIGD